MFIPRKILEEKLGAMLTEDLGEGDITTSLIVPEQIIAEAEVISKRAGTVAGVEEAVTLIESVGLEAEAKIKDGDKIRPHQILFMIHGNARTILAIERTLLNVMSRMSGIATATSSMIEKIRKAGVKAKVACTRKTAPGLLYFDKKAVILGGGDPHRFRLDDMVLIKDNHIAIAGSVAKAVRKAKENASFSKKVEVEVVRIDDILPAVQAGADIVMLDNFSSKQVENAVCMLRKKGLRDKVLIEASGGITEKNILEYASKGVDIISVGVLTSGSPALDMSLEIKRILKKGN
jgi:nicotinate-nucleotide pyrophosphorylase (carboxylating)